MSGCGLNSHHKNMMVSFANNRWEMLMPRLLVVSEKSDREPLSTVTDKLLLTTYMTIAKNNDDNDHFVTIHESY